MSKNRNAVEFDGHMKWLTSRLGREAPKLFIATIDHVPVGTFRIDDDEISYTVAPDHRGEGIATRMLTEARKMFGPLRAEIYERNTASIKAAKAAGHTVVILAEATA